MYDSKNLIYIFTMLECIEKAWIYTKGFENPNDFIWANEQKELNATISLFIAIGEEAKKIDSPLKEAVHCDLSRKDIAGISDKISHDYRGIDADILWIVIKKDLPKLKDSLIEMAYKVCPSEELLHAFLSSPHYKHIQYLK